MRQRVAKISLGLLVALAGSLLAGCTTSTSVAESPSATFSPAPVAVDAYSLYSWGPITELRGPLVPGERTVTKPFRIKRGPVRVAGIIYTTGPRNPRFDVRVVPAGAAPDFSGYPCVPSGESLYGLRMTASDFAVIMWCPYDLPAGSYRLVLHQLQGDARGDYRLWPSGAKSSRSVSKGHGGLRQT